jgi:hypothetical protein
MKTDRIQGVKGSEGKNLKIIKDWMAKDTYTSSRVLE